MANDPTEIRIDVEPQPIAATTTTTTHFTVECFQKFYRSLRRQVTIEVIKILLSLGVGAGLVSKFYFVFIYGLVFKRVHMFKL